MDKDRKAKWNPVVSYGFQHVPTTSQTYGIIWHLVALLSENPGVTVAVEDCFLDFDPSTCA